MMRKKKAFKETLPLPAGRNISSKIKQQGPEKVLHTLQSIPMVMLLTAFSELCFFKSNAKPTNVYKFCEDPEGAHISG